MLHTVSADFQELNVMLETEGPTRTWIRGPKILTVSTPGLCAASLTCPIAQRVRVELVVRSERGGWAEVEGWEALEE